MKGKGWIDPQDAWWCHFQAALRPRCIPVGGVESVSAALRLRGEGRGRKHGERRGKERERGRERGGGDVGRRVHS